MEKFIPPILNKEVACIVSSEADLELVARISCFLYKSDNYVPMFRLPKADFKRRNVYEANDDSFISELITNKASRQILNSIAHIQCRRVILIGLDENQKSFLNLEKYFSVEFIELNTLNEIDTKLSFLTREFDGILPCRKADILHGLVYSLRSNKLLVVDESAQCISNFYDNNSEGIVIVESEGAVTEIFVVNYSCSIKADIKFIRSYHHSELRDLKQRLYKWKREDSYGSFLSFNNTIIESLSDVKFEEYKYATFFTDGIPYGVIFNEYVACTHVLKSINVDVFIFNNILYEEKNTTNGSAVIFSPLPQDLGKQTIAEVRHANRIFNEMNFSVKNLIEKDATVKAFDNFVGHYPFDVLHICSHGGKIDGYYVIQEFIDREGNKHVVEYEEVVGFSPDGKVYVNVSRKMIFRLFDGFAWRSAELEQQHYPKYVFTDMLKALYSDDRKVNRNKVDNILIEDSCHVQCFDDIHQGQFNSIASHGLPFIFNNSCTSWEEFALQLIAAGCRAYIGTLWNINNEVAVSSASVFYNGVFNNTILGAFQEMINSIENEKYKDIYIYCGLHFSTIKKSSNNSKNRVRDNLLEALDQWISYTFNQKSVELLEAALRIIKFLNSELTSYFDNPKVIKALVGSAIIINDLEMKLKRERTLLSE